MGSLCAHHPPARRFTDLLRAALPARHQAIGCIRATLALLRLGGAWAFVGLTCGCVDELPDLGRRPVDIDGSATTSSVPGVVFVEPDVTSTSDASASDDEPFTHGGAEPQQPEPEDLEPRRDRALTLLSGVVDASFVYFCSERSVDGVRVFDDPVFPTDGLRYGEGLVLGPEALDWDEPLNWWLVASQRPLPEGASCRELYSGLDPRRNSSGLEDPDGASAGDTFGVADASVADASVVPGTDDAGSDESSPPVREPDGSANSSDAAFDSESDAGLRVDLPQLRFVPFVSIPAGVLGEELSYLLVASGCVGGYPAVADELCGASYASRQSSLAPVFASLSRRTEFSSLGLQFCNASALPRATLRSDPSAAEDGVFFTIGSDVVAGSVAPRSARTGVALEQIGTPLADVALRVESGLRSEPTYETTWSEMMMRSPPTEFANGRAVTLVLLGPAAPLSSLGIADGTQFNSPVVVLISNDPGRESVGVSSPSDAATPTQ